MDLFIALGLNPIPKIETIRGDIIIGNFCIAMHLYIGLKLFKPYLPIVPLRDPKTTRRELQDVLSDPG